MYKIAIIKTSMRTMLYISGISHSVALILAAYSHTLGLLMSKLRSSLEAGKKQPRVWIEYVCSVAKMLLYPSFGAPSVFLYSLCGGSEMSWCSNVNLTEVFAVGNIFSLATDGAIVALRSLDHNRVTISSCLDMSKHCQYFVIKKE